jgi:hypothetical protein
MAFLIEVLATYRLAHLIVDEQGPFNVAMKLRNYIFNTPGVPQWVQEGFNCVLCVSFWLAFPIVLSVRTGFKWREYIIEGLGVAGACLALHRWLYGH